MLWTNLKPCMQLKALRSRFNNLSIFLGSVELPVLVIRRSVPFRICANELVREKRSPAMEKQSFRARKYGVTVTCAQKHNAFQLSLVKTP